MLSKLQQFRPLDWVRTDQRWSRITHIVARGVLPFLLLLLVRADVVPLAFVLVVLSKWRILAVRPRFWLANVRSNSIDLLVGFSTVIFLTSTFSFEWQLTWTVLFTIWQVLVKPSDKVLLVSIQAFIGEICGLMAIWLNWGDVNVLWLSLLSALVCYLCARHFFDPYEEAYVKALSYLWAVFGAASTWLMAHLLFFYGVVAQPVILLGAISFGLGALYYLDHFDRNSKLVRREILILMIIIVVIILSKLAPLMFYVWSDSVL
jgi:hypothetical protein